MHPLAATGSCGYGTSTSLNPQEPCASHAVLPSQADGCFAVCWLQSVTSRLQLTPEQAAYLHSAIQEVMSD
jgi:hypothetical protein